MRIGIIGAGALGKALALRLRGQGHEIKLCFSRDAAQLAAVADDLGVGSGDVGAVAAWAEVVALAAPWDAVPTALAQAGTLDGKIVWDCTNPLLKDFSGLSIGTTTSAGEELARLVPGAHVIKGIPPMAELLASEDPTVNGRAAGLFVAGDNADAKATVAGLMASLPAEVTDAGDLTAARFIEPAMMLLVRLAYGLGHGPRVSLRFDRERRV